MRGLTTTPTNGLFALALLALGAAACSDAEDAEAPPLAEPTGLITTADGHVLWLRGINVSGMAKGAEDHLFDLSPSDVDTLLSSGINAARLLTFWKAITPEAPAAVDQGYLEAFAERVQMLADAGLYVVVDMHQDVWGVPFASHGAPGWACPDEITAGYEPTSPWWANYATRQVTGCFDLFWAEPDLQQAFTDAWLAMAAAVCDEPRVLGFDLLNEPYPGTPLFDPRFDNEVLLPFYLRLVDAIDAVCPGKRYFLEPSAGFVLGQADPLEIPAERREQIVWAGHFYPREIHEPDGNGYDGDREALEQHVLATVGHQLDRGVPVWIGEYGGITTTTDFDRYVQDVNAVFAEHNVSAVLWDYYLSDGGFAFLNAAGERKPLFDPVYATPQPSELPSVPALSPDWNQRRIALDFECVVGRHVTVLLPEDGCSCAATPAAALAEMPTAAGFATAACQTDGAVELVCSCTP